MPCNVDLIWVNCLVVSTFKVCPTVTVGSKQNRIILVKKIMIRRHLKTCGRLHMENLLFFPTDIQGITSLNNQKIPKPLFLQLYLFSTIAL